MDNTDNTKDLEQKIQIMLAEVRGKILIANMALATAMDVSFIATYENKDGICCMAMKVDNTAVLAALATGSNIIHKSNIVLSLEQMSEQRSVIKCEDSEDAEQLWELITDRMYAWSQDEIDIVDID